MGRFLATWFAVLILAGCRAPMPSLDLLAPYGTTRVAPPSTGAYDSSSPYYPSPSSAPATTPATVSPPVGAGLRTNSTGSSRWALDASPGESVAESDSIVVPGAPAHLRIQDEGVIRPVDYEEAELLPAGIVPRLRGMPVNDATQLSEPRPFQPPPQTTDISQLPRAAVTGVETTLRSDVSGWRNRTAGVDSLRVANH